MRELNQNNNLPCLIIGDFNEILFSTEKEGGNPRPQGFMDAFRDALMDCGLEDLAFSGDAFTWKRGRIRERLDRGVANGAWLVMHLAASVQHLDYIRSDHRPILVDTKEDVHQPSTKQKCFEAKWLQEKGFQEKLQQTWEAVTNEYPTNNILAKLNKLHGVLHEWDANVLQNPRKSLKRAQKKLEKAMNGLMNNDNEVVAKEMAELIDLLLEQEETHWMQRSRANWLKHGDRNTSFFHHYATTRRKFFFIKNLKMPMMSGLKVLIS
jgi:hypothetical protein